MSQSEFLAIGFLCNLSYFEDIFEIILLKTERFWRCHFLYKAFFLNVNIKSFLKEFFLFIGKRLECMEMFPESFSQIVKE